MMRVLLKVETPLSTTVNVSKIKDKRTSKGRKALQETKI
jgi:hypothetical protein